MKRTWFVNGACGLLLLFLVAASYCYLCYSAGAPPYTVRGDIADVPGAGTFRTWEEHESLYPPGDGNYVLETSHGDSALLYFGAKHSRDPNHPQVKRIKSAWNRFQPTVALHEGRARGYMLGAIFERLDGLSEPMLVHKLARRSGVPMYTLEPPYEREIGILLERFAPEQLALHFTMNTYWSEAQGTPSEELALDLLRKRTDVAGLRGTLTKIEDIDRAWKATVAGAGDWRARRSAPQNSIFSEISEQSRTIRGEHMTRTLVDLVRSGERVFAVVGCSHVIRQEPVLRIALGELHAAAP